MASKLFSSVIRLVNVSSDPSSGVLSDGDVWYNTVTDRVMARANGSTKAVAFTDDIPSATGTVKVDAITSTLTTATSISEFTIVSVPLTVGVWQFDAYLHWDFNGNNVGFVTGVYFTGTGSGPNTHYRMSSAGGLARQFDLGLNALSTSSSSTTDTYFASHTGAINVTVAGDLELHYKRNSTSGVCQITNSWIRATKE